MEKKKSPGFISAKKLYTSSNQRKSDLYGKKSTPPAASPDESNANDGKEDIDSIDDDTNSKAVKVAGGGSSPNSEEQRACDLRNGFKYLYKLFCIIVFSNTSFSLSLSLSLN